MTIETRKIANAVLEINVSEKDAIIVERYFAKNTKLDLEYRKNQSG